MAACGPGLRPARLTGQLSPPHCNAAERVSRREVVMLPLPQSAFSSSLSPPLPLPASSPAQITW